MPSKLHCTAVYIKVRCQKSLDRLCNGSGYLEIVDKSRLHRPLNHRAIGSRFRTVHDGDGFVRFMYGHGFVRCMTLSARFGVKSAPAVDNLVWLLNSRRHGFIIYTSVALLPLRLSDTDIHCTLYTLEYVVLHVCNFILITVVCLRKYVSRNLLLKKLSRRQYFAVNF